MKLLGFNCKDSDDSCAGRKKGRKESTNSNCFPDSCAGRKKGRKESTNSNCFPSKDKPFNAKRATAYAGCGGCGVTSEKSSELPKYSYEMNSDSMQLIAEKVASYHTKVIAQRPTKMQTLGAKSIYFYNRPCEEQSVFRPTVFDYPAKKLLGLGPGDISRVKFYSPSILGWSAVACVSCVYFSLYLIEHGLPRA